MFNSKEDAYNASFYTIAKLVQQGDLPKAKYRVYVAKDLSESHVFLKGEWVFTLSDDFKPIPDATTSAILVPVTGVRK
jgi:hypothetical protein